MMYKILARICKQPSVNKILTWILASPTRFVRCYASAIFLSLILLNVFTGAAVFLLDPVIDEAFIGTLRLVTDVCNLVGAFNLGRVAEFLASFREEE